MLSRLIVFVLLSAASVECLFDCSRDGVCNNGGTCDTTAGTCTCVATFTGDRCDFILANAAAAPCPTADPCVSGTCYGDGAAATCECDAGFTGTNCDTLTFSANCDITGSAHTSLRFIPELDDPTTFTGRVYALGHPGTPSECQMDCSSTPGVCTMASLAWTGSTCTDVTTDANGNNIRTFVIEYILGLSSPRDEKALVTCGSSNTADVEVTMTATFDDTVLGENSVDLVPDATDLTISATPTTGVIGDDIVLSIDLSDDGAKIYKQIFIETCSFSDPSDTFSAAFIENGCVKLDYLGANVVSFSRTGTTHDITHKAVRVNDQDTLEIDCTVRVCVVEADCAEITCGSDTSYGRKKRQASEFTNKTEERHVHAVLKILDKYEAEKAANGQENASACYMKWQTTATIIALAVCMLIALIVCMVLVVKTVLNRKKNNNDDVTSSTATLPAYKN